jgi:hypothetical protein
MLNFYQKTDPFNDALPENLHDDTCYGHGRRCLVSA